MAMIGGPMAQTPDMLQAVLTDPRATPQQRAAAVAQLNAMGGGGGQQSAPAPQAAPAPSASDPSDWLSSGAAAASGGTPASGGATPDASGGTGDLAGWHGDFMKMIKAQLASDTGGGGLTSEDKGLALAQAGFGMASSKSPHPLQALGEGALYGVDALQKLKAERAQDRIKSLALANTAMGTEALMGQRAANTSRINQGVGFNADAVMTRESLQPLIENAANTGDISFMSKLGVGAVGGKNKALAVSMLNEVSPDLANQALTFAQAKSEHEGYGKGMGERAAGPSTLNPSSGQITNPAPAPAPLATARSAPAIAVAAPAAAPVALPSPAPKPVAPPSQKPDSTPYDAIPAPPPLPQPTTPSMKTELDKRAESLGAMSDKIDAAANAAKQMNFVYSNMTAARDHFVTGKGSTVWNEANAYLLQAANGINSVLGDKTIDTTDMENKVGNYQDFKKNGVNLIGSATKAVSPRASTQEMTFLGQGVPNNEMTDKGYDLIVNQLQAVQDFALAQQKAKTLYIDNPKNTSKTMNDFDSWFNNSVDPAVFMLHRMPQEDAMAAIQSIKRSNPQMASKLINQLQTAQKLGLFAEQ